MRIGNVAYLNAAPLVYGVEAVDDVDLCSETPAVVAQDLARGALDVGLIPVYEAARLGLYAVPGVGVVCHGAVQSVLLLSRVPVDKIETLALDPASRSSAALVQLLLRRTYGLMPTVVTGPNDGDPLGDDVDAALVIGDRAMKYTRSSLAIDLGEWWFEETGLPFVFAIWAGTERDRVVAVAPTLIEARNRGLECLDEIAQRESAARSIDLAITRDYLRNAIQYHVGEAERSGLTRYLDLLREASLIQSDATIHWI